MTLAPMNHNGTWVFGDHDAKTLDQMSSAVSSSPDRVAASALMADGHFGYGMPIGGVIAYHNAVSPEGVGYDIGCGNKAVLTDLMAADVDIPHAMDRIFDEIPFGTGKTSGKFGDHPIIGDIERAAGDHPGILTSNLREKARVQLGSVGSGNHYVDLLVDTEGRLWVGVHFGSRGFGWTIADCFISSEEKVTVIGLETDYGQDYWDLMELAGAYAYAGRDCVVDQVVSEILGGVVLNQVHNHHNFAWIETHRSEVVVVRKGATPAFPGQMGFVGGSMGDNAVILEGSWYSDTSVNRHRALESTVHGAGRVMGRRAAKGKWKKGVQVSPGRILQEDMDTWVDAAGVELRGAGLDEAPQAYRRLPDVLEAQTQTITVMEVLRPIGVAMASAGGWNQ